MAPWRVNLQLATAFLHFLPHITCAPAVYSRIFRSRILHLFSPALLHSRTPAFYQHPSVLSMTKLMFNKLISLKLTLRATSTQNSIYHLVKTHNKVKKRSDEMQTLRAGCSKVEPKIFAPPQAKI